MGRIRICEMITELSPAGAERSVYELAKRLDRDLFDVRVVALRGGAVVEWLAEAGVETHVLGVRGRWDLLKLRPLVDLLRREQVDILHTHLFHADLAGRAAASLAGVPHLVHSVRTAEGRFRPWQYAFARVFSEGCERIVCVSQSVRDIHMSRSGLPPGAYRTIENGVDAGAFARDEASRARLRDQWGLARDQPLAAFVGRLAEEKGVDVLLGTMSHLASRGEAIHLVIAGEGPQRRVVETFIAHGEGGGHCRLLGFVRDVVSIYSAADMLVMPSRWEGWPLAAAEAMAASLPVVATDVPGLREVVTDGQTGILTAPGDVVAMAEAVDILARDGELRRRMGRAARAKAVESFSIDATVAAHEKLYLEIAGG